MSKRSTPPAAAPIGADLSDAIARLQLLAASAALQPMLADEAASPDAELLEICSAIGRKRRHLDALVEPHREPLSLVQQRQLHLEFDATLKDLRKLIQFAAKLPATTPAALFAKAIAIRCTRDGSIPLGLSLAADLLGSATLRAAIWPVVVEEARQ